MGCKFKDNTFTISIISLILGLFWTLLYIIFGIIGSVYAGRFDIFSSTPLYAKVLLHILPVITAPVTLFALFHLRQTPGFVRTAASGAWIALMMSIGMLVATTVEFKKMDYIIDEKDRPTIEKLEKDGNCCVAVEIRKKKSHLRGIKIFPECHLVTNKTIQIYPDRCTTEFGMKACEMNIDINDPEKYICKDVASSDKTFVIVMIVFESIQVAFNIFFAFYLTLNALLFDVKEEGCECECDGEAGALCCLCTLCCECCCTYCFLKMCDDEDTEHPDAEKGIVKPQNEDYQMDVNEL